MNFLLALPIALLGFTVASAMASALGEHTLWLLTAGITASVILPSLVASWLRSLLRGKHKERTDRAGVARPVLDSGKPSTAGTIVVLNIALIIACAVFAPAETQTRLRTTGAWWIREVIDLGHFSDGDEMTAKGERVIGWIAALLPGGGPLPAEGEAGAPGTDGGAATGADSGVPRTDGMEALAPGEEYLVSFKKEGSAVVVPVLFSGPSGTVKVKMIFDTGATLTTLDRATLRRLGADITASSPTVMSHTANGTVKRRLTVVDGAALGAARVPRGLTVSACEPCAKGEVKGLLGLNFSRNFKISMDHDAGRIGLAPKLPAPDHTYDARHFIKLDDARGLWRGPMLGVDLVVRNLSSRVMRDVRISAEVTTTGGKRLLKGTIKDLPARSNKPLHLQGILKGKKGRTFNLKVVNVVW